MNGEVEKRLARIEEGLSWVEGALKEMSSHTRDSLNSIEDRLNRLEARLDGKAGKWEVRIWMMILIAVVTIFGWVTNLQPLRKSVNPPGLQTRRSFPWYARGSWPGPRPGPCL